MPIAQRNTDNTMPVLSTCVLPQSGDAAKCCCNITHDPGGYVNHACGCPEGTVGGITACDGFSQLWPASVSGTVSPRLSKWSIEMFDFAFVNFDTSYGVATESTISAWKGHPPGPKPTLADIINPDYHYDPGINSNTISADVSWTVVGSLSLPASANVSCGISAKGTYFKVKDTEGASYTFDTISGSGMPRLVLAYEQTDVHEWSGNDVDTYVAYDSVGPYSYSSAHPNGLWHATKQNGSFFKDVNLLDRADCGSGITTVASTSNGEVSVHMTFAPAVSKVYWVDYAEQWTTPPGGYSGAYDYGDLAGIDFGDITLKTTTIYHGYEASVLRFPGHYTYVLGDAVAAGSTTNKICTGPITRATSSVYVHETLLDRYYNGAFFRSVDVYRDTSDTHNISGGGISSATTSAGTPANPGCMSCNRAYQVKMVNATTGEVIFDELFKQVCNRKATSFVAGWPYSCLWTSPTGRSISKVGPLEWDVAGRPGKSSADCPGGWLMMADAAETLIATYATSVGTSPQVVTRHIGKTVLTIVNYTVTCEPVELTTKLCCACDDDDPELCKDPSCRGEGDCTTLDDVVVAHIDLSGSGEAAWLATLTDEQLDDDPVAPVMVSTLHRGGGTSCTWTGTGSVTPGTTDPSYIPEPNSFNFKISVTSTNPATGEVFSEPMFMLEAKDTGDDLQSFVGIRPCRDGIHGGYTQIIGDTGTTDSVYFTGWGIVGYVA